MAVLVSPCRLQTPHDPHDWCCPTLTHWFLCQGRTAPTPPPLIADPQEPWKRRHPSMYQVGPVIPQGVLPIKLSHRDAIIALDRYITERHSILWGGVWTITDEERREDAIDWFIGVCESIGLLAPTTTPEPRNLADVVPINKEMS